MNCWTRDFILPFSDPLLFHLSKLRNRFFYVDFSFEFRFSFLSLFFKCQSLFFLKKDCCLVLVSGSYSYITPRYTVGISSQLDKGRPICGGGVRQLMCFDI